MGGHISKTWLGGRHTKLYVYNLYAECREFILNMSLPLPNACLVMPSRVTPHPLPHAAALTCEARAPEQWVGAYQTCERPLQTGHAAGVET